MDYFNNLFGEPELTRRENWDGKEEPLRKETPNERWDRLAWQLQHGEVKASDVVQEMTTPLNTIDIEHEVVD